MDVPKKQLIAVPEPWTPAQATDRLRAIARSENFGVTFKQHALDQLSERDLTTSDALYVLKNGFVYDKPNAAKQPGLFRYAMSGPTPNSNSRVIRVVVIPSMHAAQAKIVTVMWADEPIVGGKK